MTLDDARELVKERLERERREREAKTYVESARVVDEYAVSGLPPVTLVERVARALWARTVEIDPDVGGEWESASPEWREQYLALADAAVQEIWGGEEGSRVVHSAEGEEEGGLLVDLDAG